LSDEEFLARLTVDPTDLSSAMPGRYAHHRPFQLHCLGCLINWFASIGGTYCAALP